MGPLYVTQFEINGHPCVIIYKSADSLERIISLHLKAADMGKNYLGTIEHQFLSTSVVKAIEDHGYSIQERPDFDRDHADHLVQR